MENSRGRIEGLRLFESVRVTPEYSDRERGSTVENLMASVKESNTSFQIGGFSTDYGAFASVIVAQTLTSCAGAGRTSGRRRTEDSFAHHAGGRFNNYELDFEEPWLMGKAALYNESLQPKVGDTMKI